MLTMLKNWKGSIEINGVLYDSVQDALKIDSKTFSESMRIVLHSKSQNASQRATAQSMSVSDDSQQYRITVKQYMTKKSTPEFDFMLRWNDNKPMPMRTMVGTVEKETRGMVYMKLHGEAQKTITCACCGKELTNPVSRYYGIGPICLGKLGIARDISDIENIKEDLVNVVWEGWIIKSSITEREEV